MFSNVFVAFVLCLQPQHLEEVTVDPVQDDIEIVSEGQSTDAFAVSYILCVRKNTCIDLITYMPWKYVVNQKSQKNIGYHCAAVWSAFTATEEQWNIFATANGH